MKVGNVIAVMAAVTCLVGQLPAQSVVARTDGDQTSALSERRVTLHLSNVTLSQVLDDISKQSGIAINIGERVIGTNRTVSLNVESVMALEAVKVVIKGTDLSVRASGTDRLMVVRSEQIHRAAAQGVVGGRVSDSKTGKEIPGANISVDGRSAVTGEDGIYRVTGVTTGTHVVAARLLGYAKQTRSVTVGDGATVVADFKLEPSASVLGEVVVTGTVVATELKAVPSAITVITAKQIEERGITRIDQLFHGDIPGLFSQNRGSGNALDSVAMFSRGGTAFQSGTGNPVTNPIKTYVDGIELANAIFLSQIDPRSIERIEILTGPQASTIYGSNAINGVMQIFTKRGLTARPQTVLNLTSGVIQNNFSPALAPMHTYDGRVAGTEKRLSYNVGGSWDYVGAWTPAKKTQRLSGYGGGRAQFESLVIDMSARSGLTRNQQLGSSAQWGIARGEAGFNRPQAAGGRSSPTTSTLTGQTNGLTMSYTPLTWWSHELVFGSDMSRAETVKTGSAYTEPYDTILRLTSNQNSRVSQRYTTTAKVPLSRSSAATLTFGVDHWRSQTIGISAFPLSLTGQLADPTVTRSHPEKNSGGFVQGQIGIHDMFFLTYGLRAEWNPNYGEDAQPNVTPRYGVAMTRDIGPVTAKLRGSYGRSTRPPTISQRKAISMTTNSLYDQYFASLYGPFDSRLANPNLEPEFQQGAEGGIELYFGGRGSLVITRYNQTVDGLIALISAVDSVRSLVPLPPGVFAFQYVSIDPDGFGYFTQSQSINVGSIRNQGWELQGSVNTGPISTRGTYSWTKSRMIGITPRYRSKLTNSWYQPGFTFDLLPEHTWALNVAYGQAATSISLNINGTGFRYRGADPLLITVVSNTPRLDNNNPRKQGLPSLYRSTGSGYATADLNASHRFSSLCEGIVQVQNLTNYYQNDYRINEAVIGRQTKAGIRIRM